MQRPIPTTFERPDPPIRREGARVDRARGLDFGPVTVVVADDHSVFREGLAGALARRAEFEVVGQATNGADAQTLIQEMQPHVALLDVRMPAPDGLSLCRTVRRSDARHRPHVVILSAFSDFKLVARAALAGADGYIDKSTPAPEICAAVLDVARGSTAFTADGTDVLERMWGGDIPPAA